MTHLLFCLKNMRVPASANASQYQIFSLIFHLCEADSQNKFHWINMHFFICYQVKYIFVSLLAIFISLFVNVCRVHTVVVIFSWCFVLSLRDLRPFHRSVMYDQIVLSQFDWNPWVPFIMSFLHYIHKQVIKCISPFLPSLFTSPLTNS